MYLAMSLNRSYDYVTGDTIAPDTLLEPQAPWNWKSNDRSTCAFISSAISDAEWKALSDPPCSDVKAYWAKLDACHSSDGPVAQVYLLKQAMNIVITSPSESITKTIDKATDLVCQAYAMNPAGGLVEETFLSIITLNALGKEHEAIQFQLQDRLQQATPQSPFSFTQIWAPFWLFTKSSDTVQRCQWASTYSWSQCKYFPSPTGHHLSFICRNCLYPHPCCIILHGNPWTARMDGELRCRKPPWNYTTFYAHHIRGLCWTQLLMLISHKFDNILCYKITCSRCTTTRYIVGIVLCKVTL